MKVHYLQHMAFEGLGSIQGWVECRRAAVTTTRLYLNEPLPAADKIDLLIIMGGAMGTYDEDQFPWLRPEKEFIRQVVNRGSKALGVCLGSQLLAEVLGGRVFRHTHREIGWFPVERMPAADASRFGAVLPQQCQVFHWHGDTFDLPPGATHLARSAGCENQAFSIGDQVLALQFHLEASPEFATALAKNCSGDLQPGPFVQRSEEFARADRPFAETNRLMDALLNQLVDGQQR